MNENTLQIQENLPKNSHEWRKWKEERKALKRKWNEKKMIKKLEKEKNVNESQNEMANSTSRVENISSKLNNSNGRKYTVAIALPGSILENAQTPELRTYLAGQIARAAVVFNIDEIIIFDDSGSTDKTADGKNVLSSTKRNCNVQMALILQYLECPQYLRKAFFPQHHDLKFVGLLNPLDTPHHMKEDDNVPFREGIVLNKPVKTGNGSFVNVGLKTEIQIDRQLQSGLRVTVDMHSLKDSTDKKQIKSVVSPQIPRIEHGIYWGYNVRIAGSLSKVFTESPFKKGYDLLIGTSEKGENIDQADFPFFRHMVIVFGGVKGLEASLDADQELKVDDPSYLFNIYLNSCPHQGSHTIRTEEAILITLSAIRPKILQAIS